VIDNSMACQMRNVTLVQEDENGLCKNIDCSVLSCLVEKF